MWIPKPHQISGAKEVAAAMTVYKWHYLAWEERVGKSLTALHGMHQAGFKNVLIITKKGENDKVIKGWKEAILNSGIDDCLFTVINYHKLGSATKNKKGRITKITLKYDRDEYDGVVIDESHNYISGSPKPSSFHQIVKAFVADKPVLFLSATPYAQGFQLLYHQLKVCRHTPWQDIPTFYKWFYKYGIENMKYVAAGQQRESYTIFQEEELLPFLEGHFSYLTRADVGMEHEPEDVTHYVDLDPKTKELFNDGTKDKLIDYPNYQVVCDTVSKLRATLHMLEGGVYIEHAVIENREGELVPKSYYKLLDNTEKIDYIKATWGDTNNLVIMYNYKAEKIKLEKHFDNALLLQATSNAEGVDLSMYEHLVVYSQDWSTARHSQRRARQANMEHKTPIKVNYLLVKDAISDQCYTNVSINKVNFLDKMYERRLLK